VAVEVDSAIIHLDKLRTVLAESGMLARVCSLSQMCWGVQGQAASFGQNVEVRSLALSLLVRLRMVKHHRQTAQQSQNLLFLDDKKPAAGVGQAEAGAAGVRGLPYPQHPGA